MEDTYGEGSVPLSSRFAIMRTGVAEHLREVGLGGGEETPGERVRSGSLLVLCGWALFVIAGSAFAKMTEHWVGATPQGDRALPINAYDAVQLAASVGLVIVLVAAAIALPAVPQFLRDGGVGHGPPTSRPCTDHLDDDRVAHHRNGRLGAPRRTRSAQWGMGNPPRWLVVGALGRREYRHLHARWGCRSPSPSILGAPSSAGGSPRDALDVGDGHDHRREPSCGQSRSQTTHRGCCRGADRVSSVCPARQRRSSLDCSCSPV